MKLPELPSLNNEKLNKKGTSGALSLPDLDSPGLNSSRDLSNENKSSSGEFELPDLIEFDNMLKKEDENKNERKKFDDIPLNTPEEKLEPNQMFADLPIDVEFKGKPPMFQDIPINKNVETSNEKLEDTKDFDDITPITREVVSQPRSTKIESQAVDDTTRNIKEDSEKTVESKKPAIIKPEVIERPQRINNETIEEITKDNHDEQIDDMMDELQEDFDFQEVPNDEELDIEDEDYEDYEENFEEDFGFLPQVNFEEDEEPIEDTKVNNEKDNLESNNEFDEEKIKLFFAGLKDKIFKRNKKPNKIKPDKSKKDNKEKKKKPSKLKKPKGTKSSNKVINILKYAMVIVVFVIAVIFLFSKVGSFGGSYSPIEELTAEAKMKNHKLELSNFNIEDRNMSFEITNDGETSLSFLLNATLKTKSKLKTSKIKCESGIMSIAPGDVITEKIYCEEKIEEDFKYKVDIDIQEVQ